MKLPDVNAGVKQLSSENRNRTIAVLFESDENYLVRMTKYRHMVADIECLAGPMDVQVD